MTHSSRSKPYVPTEKEKEADLRRDHWEKSARELHSKMMGEINAELRENLKEIKRLLFQRGIY